MGFLFARRVKIEVDSRLVGTQGAPGRKQLPVASNSCAMSLADELAAGADVDAARQRGLYLAAHHVEDAGV